SRDRSIGLHENGRQPTKLIHVGVWPYAVVVANGLELRRNGYRRDLVIEHAAFPGMGRPMMRSHGILVLVAPLDTAHRGELVASLVHRFPGRVLGDGRNFG